MTGPSPEEQFANLVRNEIKELQGYFSKQLIRYRYARTIVIASAGAVPVLASVSSIPRWLLGLFGAISIATEGIQQLYQFRLSSLNALQTANDLERELNIYFMAVKDYTGLTVRDADSLFVERIEEIRKRADSNTLNIWRQSTSPSGEQRRGDPSAD